MYFPKLFNLLTEKRFGNYSPEVITKIDDYLGSLEIGTSFSEGDFNFSINDTLLTDKIINDLVKLEIVEEFKEDFSEEGSDEKDEEDKRFILMVEPNKLENKDYQEYRKQKRKIDSFSIIYEKTKQKKSGALTLIDLKGYSKNINSDESNPAILLLVQKIQNLIQQIIRPYFLNSYSGIEIKQNGDGWFLYFIQENESYEFLNKFLLECKEDSSIQNQFKTLGTSLKCYIHHAKEIERIYKVDTLHFDMEGKDVILIHMLEKPIENILYNGLIPRTSSFIAITETVYSKIDSNYLGSFRELKEVTLNVKDSEGNNKLINSDIKIYYKEYS